ncbi:MAG: tryptophan--tRNA ligase [Cytophagales bacterium]|jgi:tryptophanyl-tRNA synthetase|nr:tryptophan--tRNA ligase [Cytophagales bacterium]
MGKKILLTGDRPTGKLHLGHYVGSLKKRVELQEDDQYKMFVMIADMQGLSDNGDNPDKVRNNILEVMLDYLAVGMDPEKIIIFQQSQIRELMELTIYFSNLVSVPRLQRNPTIKTEIQYRGFGDNIPLSFLMYPVSQAADITLFKTNFVPAGEDQEPLVELTRDIVKDFNKIFGNVLIEPELILNENKYCRRLPGIDGNSKMSKSLGNAIFLSDDEKTIKEKIKMMYTDSLHVKVEDPGHLDGNVPFIYLQALGNEKYFRDFLPDYKNLSEMEEHYLKGGLGDGTVKKFLTDILLDIITPIYERRLELQKDMKIVKDLLGEGTSRARRVAEKNIQEIREVIFG